jgi:hypothetical protein
VSGRPLGKALNLKTFVGREQLRWDAMQEQLRPFREVIKLAVFDMSHFGKGLKYSAHCHQALHVGNKRSMRRGVNSPYLNND